MDLKLEVVVVPVSDVDRAKAFYEKLGLRLDIDYTDNNGRRIVQFTPPDSEASIHIGKGIMSAEPGSPLNTRQSGSSPEDATAAADRYMDNVRYIPSH